MKRPRACTGGAAPRLLRLVLPLLVLASCSDSERAVMTAPEVTPAAVFSLMPATTSTASGVAFLPPLGESEENPGTFDASLLDHLAFEVCQRTADGECGPVLATLTSAAGAKGKGGKGASASIKASGGSYHANWDVDGVGAGTDLRIRVLAAGTDLGHVDGVVVANMRDAKSVEARGLVAIQAKRTLPIQVRIDQGVVWVVGSEGRTFATTDGAVRIGVPAGALSAPVGLTVRPVLSPLAEPTLVPGTAFEVGPAVVAFATPAEVTFRYGDARPEADTVPAGRFRLHRVALDGPSPTWVQDFPSTSDVEAGTVAGQLAQAGTIAVLRRRVPARVEITPAESTLDAFGATGALAAMAYAAGGWPITDADFAWRLSGEPDAEIVGAPVRDGTYGESATVEALANGTAGVVVSTEGVSGTASVTVRQVPAAIELSLGDTELDAIDDTTSVLAVVRDANGHLIEDDALIHLSWTSGSPSVATVAGIGPRAALATAAGNGVATLAATDAQGASGTVDLTVEQKPFGIEAISGDGQVAAPGQALAEPFVAEVQDANGHSIADVAVTWAVLSGGGSLAAPDGVTDASGRASALLTLGGQVELNQVQVSVTDLPEVSAVMEAMPSAPPVTTSGGDVVAFDGAVTLGIPAGALSSSTPISVRPVDPDEFGLEPGDVLPGTMYQFGPSGLTFAASDSVLEPEDVPDQDLPPEFQADAEEPPVVTDPDANDPPDVDEVQYQDDEIDLEVEETPEESLELEEPVELTLRFDQLPEGESAADVDALVIARWNPDTEEWEEMEGSYVDPQAQTVSAPVEHFSLYAVRLRARAPRIYGAPSGGTRRWAGFRANTQVTWKVYRKNRWGGRVAVDRRRHRAATRRPQNVRIYPYGPGPWIVQATAKKCGYVRDPHDSWVNYSLFRRAVTRGRVKYQWSYLRDDKGRIVRKVYQGRTFVKIRRYLKRWTCATATTRHTFRALSPVPHSVALRPAGTRNLERLGAYYPLYVRVFDAAGRYMPWARVTFSESSDPVFRVFNVRDTNSWDRWVARAEHYGVSTLKAVAYGGATSNGVKLTVDLIPATISVVPTSVTLSAPGETSQLQARVLNRYGLPVNTPLTWTSSSTVVEVNGSGLVTGRSPGQATVRATTSNGISAATTVIVETPPPPPPTWSISGPGTTSVAVETDANGTADVANYSLDGSTAGYSTQTWQFSATASASGSVQLPWTYSGLHSWFNVRAFLTAYVRHANGTETVYSLVNAGPKNNGQGPPSGGFTYTGTTTLPVQAGETYGFRFGGSHYDGSKLLHGQLRVYRQP